MLAEGRRQVAEHRIGIAGHRHQVRRRGLLDDPRGQPAERCRLDAHVERRADVQPHRQAVQPGHEQVFHAGALQLFRGAEDFRPDEAGDVVDDRPWRRTRPAAEMSSHAVGPRLERDHVDPLGVAVGHLGPLSRLEVEAIEGAGQLGESVDVKADHPGQRPRRAGQALEADIHACPQAGGVLLDDVGQDAEAGGESETFDDAGQQLLQGDDGVEVVGGGIEPDDHVAAAVGQTLENREQDFLWVVTRAVGLDARSEADGSARRGAGRPDRGCQQPGDPGQLVAGHDLGDRGDDLAAQAVAVAPGPGRGPGCQQDLARPGDRQAVELAVGAAVAASFQRRTDAVVHEYSPPNLADRRAEQGTAGLVTNPFVGGAADRAVALLEGAGERESLAKVLLAHAPLSYDRRP